MQEPAHAESVNEVLRRIAEGRALWGTIDVSPLSRGIWQRVRLTVYPPGISRGERRLLHAFHAWPIVGAVGCLFALIPLSDAGPVLALATALAVYLAGFLVLAALSHDLRVRCHVVTAASEYVGGSLREFGDVQLLLTAGRRLVDLETQRRAGRIDPVAYEAEWAAVYDTLPASAERAAVWPKTTDRVR